MDDPSSRTRSTLVSAEEIFQFRARIHLEHQMDRAFPDFLLHCANGNVDEVKARLARAPSFAKRQNKDAETGLLYAIGSNRTECVALLAPLSDCSSRTSNRRFSHMDHLTPLMVAAHRGLHEIVHLLLEFSQPQLTNRSGQTALMIAAAAGHVRCVEALLPVSVAHRRDSRGYTALMIATLASHPECVRLLSRAAGAHLVDPKKQDALDLAVTVCDSLGSSQAMACVECLLPVLSGKRRLLQILKRLNDRFPTLSTRSPSLYACFEREILAMEVVSSIKKRQTIIAHTSEHTSVDARYREPKEESSGHTLRTKRL